MFQTNFILLFSTFLFALIEANPAASLFEPNRLIGSCRERNLCCSGRDSSCSIAIGTGQSVPVSLIGNIVKTITDQTATKECYCDSACITLGDCCADYKEACGVQDCIVSDWDQWSDCNVTCGTGIMTRNRNILAYPQNGGKECPDLNQHRTCHGQHCKVKDDNKMMREMAIILQSSFSVNRAVDENKDIRRNLRLNYPKDPLKENVNEYCVLFKITKSQKNCETLGADVYAKLKEGSKVCVHCQDAAMRPHLGYRCYGHGSKDRSTRWSMFNFSGCSGRWTRQEEQRLSNGLCRCQQQLETFNGTVNVSMNPDFIFV